MSEYREHLVTSHRLGNNSDPLSEAAALGRQETGVYQNILITMLLLCLKCDLAQATLNSGFSRYPKSVLICYGMNSPCLESAGDSAREVVMRKRFMGVM